MKYRNLTKGSIYTVKYGRRVERYTYQGRYKDGRNVWRYHFISLDKFSTFTPIAEHVVVFSI